MMESAEPQEPGFLIREARTADLRQLLALARELDSINLPTKAPEMRELIARSARSFRGRITNRAHAVYLFCAQELKTGRLAGCSLIIAKHGTPQAPHYYLLVDSEERYSHILRKLFRHTFLRLRYSMDGPTELGGLIVKDSMRQRPEQIGKQLSWVRFLYIARHRQRFEDNILAEILPPISPGYVNLFWDHYGRRVTGLSFREADQFSIHDKEFIRALFPDSPLYTFLLPDEVRDSLGTAGPASAGAIRLLEKAGMRFLNHIDPFDAGPYYGAATSELAPVKNYRVYRALAGEVPPESAHDYLLGREDSRGFRAVRARVKVVDGEMVASPRVIRALGGKRELRLFAVALP
jgi:arginine N-succinyltransferase